MSVADTVNVAVAFAPLVTLLGCVRMVGPGITVSVADELVVEVLALVLVTVTRYV